MFDDLFEGVNIRTFDFKTLSSTVYNTKHNLQSTIALRHINVMYFIYALCPNDYNQSLCRMFE